MLGEVGRGGSLPESQVGNVGLLPGKVRRREQNNNKDEQGPRYGGGFISLL